MTGLDAHYLLKAYDKLSNKEQAKIEKAAKNYIKELKINKDWERFEVSFEYDFISGAIWMKKEIAELTEEL